jgi:hypothetical protein
MKDDFRPSAAQPNPPKDKRTYATHKEHGEDMSHENERVHTNEPREDRGALDLTFLIEEHSRGPWSVVLEYFSYIHVPWFPDQGACSFRLEA